MVKDDPKLWEDMLSKIVESYPQGELIEHDYLKSLMAVRQPDYDDFENQADFVAALQDYQFKYMTFIDRIRYDILENFKMYLRSVRGDGYVFIPTKEQTDFAKKQTFSDINKALTWGVDVLQNMRLSELSMDERRRNADEVAKLSHLKSMLKGLK